MDIAFICMHERPTVPPEKAADAVLAFHLRVGILYHCCTSTPTIFKQKPEGSGVDAWLRDWYAKMT